MALKPHTKLEEVKIAIEYHVRRGEAVPCKLLDLYIALSKASHCSPIIYTIKEDELHYDVEEDFSSEVEAVEKVLRKHYEDSLKTFFDYHKVVDELKRTESPMPKIDALDGLTEKQKRAILIATQGYREIIGMLTAIIVDISTENVEVVKTHLRPDGYNIYIPKKFLKGKTFRAVSRIAPSSDDLSVEIIEIQYE